MDEHEAASAKIESHRQEDQGAEKIPSKRIAQNDIIKLMELLSYYSPSTLLLSSSSSSL